MMHVKASVALVSRSIDMLVHILYCCLVVFLCISDDVDLRNAVANLIAAVMGTPAGSSHLWAHMFDIKSLTGTYITGNLVSCYLLCWQSLFIYIYIAWLC